MRSISLVVLLPSVYTQFFEMAVSSTEIYREAWTVCANVILISISKLSHLLRCKCFFLLLPARFSYWCDFQTECFNRWHFSLARNDLLRNRPDYREQFPFPFTYRTIIERLSTRWRYNEITGTRGENKFRKRRIIHCHRSKRVYDRTVKEFSILSSERLYNIIPLRSPANSSSRSFVFDRS